MRRRSSGILPMFWNPEAMFALARGVAGDRTADQLDLAARLFDLLLGGRGERGRFDRELGLDVAFPEDLHVVRAARNHPRALKRGEIHGARREPLGERADVDDEYLLAERVLEPLLREAALHRHLTAFEPEARAVVAGARLLALDALARLLARARPGTAADALAVAGRPARALQRMQRRTHVSVLFRFVDANEVRDRTNHATHGDVVRQRHGNAHLREPEPLDGPFVGFGAVDAAPDQGDAQLLGHLLLRELLERLAAQAGRHLGAAQLLERVHGGVDHVVGVRGADALGED